MLVGCRSCTVSSLRPKVTFPPITVRCSRLVIVVFFFPGLELEDIDHIFERGGITGGVWETRGQTINKSTLRDIEEVEHQIEGKFGIGKE
jgi:hypothetical protein